MTHLHHLPADSTTIGARFGSRGETPFSGGARRQDHLTRTFGEYLLIKDFCYKVKLFLSRPFSGGGFSAPKDAFV